MWKYCLERQCADLLCPVCGGKLRLFQQMFLRQMYWYAECETNVSHFRWPRDGWGFNSQEELKEQAINGIKK